MSLDSYIDSSKSQFKYLPKAKRLVLSKLLERLEQARNDETDERGEGLTNGLIEAIEIIMHINDPFWWEESDWL